MGLLDFIIAGEVSLGVSHENVVLFCVLLREGFRFCWRRGGFFRSGFHRPALHDLPIFRREKFIFLNQFLNTLTHLGPLHFYRRIRLNAVSVGECQLFVSIGDVVVAAIVAGVCAMKMAQVFLPLLAVGVLLKEIIHGNAVVMPVRMVPQKRVDFILRNEKPLYRLIVRRGGKFQRGTPEILQPPLDFLCPAGAETENIAVVSVV